MALDPKQGTARAMLGLCEFELGQEERALKDIEESKTLGVLEDRQLRDVVMYHEGVLLQRAGKFESAKGALASLCLSGVRSGELAGTFGMVALRMRDGSPPDISTEAGQVVQHVGRAACLSGAKDYDAAKEEFERVIGGAPHFPLVHYAYGRMLQDARDHDGAIKEFEAEIAEQPKSVLPRLRIAAAEYKWNPEAGLKFAEESVKLQPELPLGHYLLGLCCWRPAPTRSDTGVGDRRARRFRRRRRSISRWQMRTHRWGGRRMQRGHGRNLRERSRRSRQLARNRSRLRTRWTRDRSSEMQALSDEEVASRSRVKFLASSMVRIWSAATFVSCLHGRLGQVTRISLMVVLGPSPK